MLLYILSVSRNFQVFLMAAGCESEEQEWKFSHFPYEVSGLSIVCFPIIRSCEGLT